MKKITLLPPRSLNKCLLLLLLALTSFLPVSGTRYTSLLNGNWSDISNVWSLDGITPCACSPGGVVSGPVDTVEINHLINLTFDLEISGNSVVILSPGAVLGGPWSISVIDGELNNQGLVGIDGLYIRPNGRAISLFHLSVANGNIEVDGGMLSLGQLTEISNGDMLISNLGHVTVLANASVQVDGSILNNGLFELEPGACVQVVDDFENLLLGEVFGEGYIQAGHDIFNSAFWGPMVNWCAGGSDFGMPTPELCSACGILPVNLSSFTASITDDEYGSVLLSWETSSELNNDFFTLERSTDGLDFELLAVVSGNRNTSGNSYQAHDPKAVNGIVTYRLSQTDLNGQRYELGVTEVSRTAAPLTQLAFTAFPNPFNTELSLSNTGPAVEHFEIRLYNLNGKQVFEMILEAVPAGALIPLNLDHLPAGAYLLTLGAGDLTHRSQLLRQ